MCTVNPADVADIPPSKAKDVEGGFTPPLLISLKRKRLCLVDSVLRLFTLGFCATSLSTMLRSDQTGLVYLFALPITISIHHTSIRAFRYLVIAMAMVAAFSIVILLFKVIRTLRKGSPHSSTSISNFSWVLLWAVDQVSTYLAISAAAAAAGMSSANELRLQTMKLPDLCSSMDVFCKQVGISIFMAILASLTSASCAALHVYTLRWGLNDAPSSIF